MKLFVSVVVLIIASVGATAQTIPGFNAGDQRSYDSLNLDQKKKVFQVVLNAFDDKMYQCPGNNKLIVLFCENAAKGATQTDSATLSALASSLGETEKAQAKSRIDVVLKRMDANIKASDDGIENLAKDELVSDAGSAKAADLSADSMLDHVTDQASFEAAISNIVKLGLLPVGVKAATYSPALVAQLKHGFEESATKFGEAKTKAQNYRPWWVTALIVVVVNLFRRGRKKTSNTSAAHPAPMSPPPPPTPGAIA